MNKYYRCRLNVVILLLFCKAIYAQLPIPDTIKTSKGNLIVQPIFHGAIVLQLGNKTIYVDPYNGANAYRGLPSPDFILITHAHQDHFDTATLNNINTTKSKLVVPKAVSEKLPSKWLAQKIVLNNGESLSESAITIKAVPMYDLPEQENARHIKGLGNGYIIEFGGKRIYLSGDTDDIEEMRKLKNIDLAFVCMNQPFTMTIQQAASAVLEFKPQIIYPYHYRNMNGFTDIAAFKKMINDTDATIDVRIRNWYTTHLVSNMAQRVENIVYGMVSGASLTMDVYNPVIKNNIGIVVIPGTAFGYAYGRGYNQPSMTANFARDTIYFGKYARTLVDKGYTIFVINHRFAPQFHYNDILADCQRAVRYIRFNARQFNINPNRIGAFGYSSGATLCAMLGLTEVNFTADGNTIDDVSSKVQSVVTLAGRFDLSDFNKKEDSTIQNPIISRVLLNYVGELPMVENNYYVLSGKYAEASPINFVDKGDATFLMYHSLDDPLVPQRQETNMYYRLISNGVGAKFTISNKEGHFPIPNINEIDYWFTQHLIKIK